MPKDQTVLPEIKRRFGLTDREALAVEHILGVADNNGKVPKGLGGALKRAGLKSPCYVIYGLKKKGVMSNMSGRLWLAGEVHLLIQTENHSPANGNGTHVVPEDSDDVETEENKVRLPVSSTEAAGKLLDFLKARADLEGESVIDSGFLFAVQEVLGMSLTEMNAGFTELEKDNLVALRPRRPADGGARVLLLSFSPESEALDEEILRLEKVISEAQRAHSRYKKLRSQMNGE